MQKVLIYGDSNTWGDNFVTGKRILDQFQWVHILEGMTGSSYKYFQEGLPGRTAGSYETIKKYKNGKDTFMSIFRTHAPLDIIIIALGTNDLQIKYNVTAEEIIDNLKWYKQIVLELYSDLEDRKKYFHQNKFPRFIYILPPNIDFEGGAKDIFDQTSDFKRKNIIQYFQKYIEDVQIIVEDISLLKDGIHFDNNGHIKMANLVFEVLHHE